MPFVHGDKGLGINDAGQIVGSFTDTGSSIQHGFLDSGGLFTTIDVPGAAQTVVDGINDAGQVVGYYSTGFGGISHGFLYVNGIFTTIDFPGALGTQLFDINDAGQIVGEFTPQPVPEPASLLLLAPSLGLLFWLSRRAGLRN